MARSKKTQNDESRLRERERADLGAMDARKGEKCSSSFNHQLPRDENMAEASPEVEQKDTGSRAGAERKRKRSTDADGSEKPQEVGPSGGGEIEEVMRKEEENKNAAADIENKEEVASSSGPAAATALGAERNTTMEQEPGVAESTPTAQLSLALGGPSDEHYINPLTIELQRIEWQKEQLKINHSTMQTKLKKEMEEELKKVRRMFEKKVEEEDIKFQQEQAYLGSAHQKLLWNQALSELAATNKSLAEQWSASASDSSQVPQPTTQLGPLPCAPLQICQAPAPRGSAPAMRTAQAGGQSGSVLRPDMPSTSSHGLLTAPRTTPLWSGPSIPAAGTAIQPPAPYTPLQHPHLTLRRPAQHLARSRPRPSAIPPATSTSSQWFGPCTGTPLQHPGQAIIAAPLAPAPHFASFQPRPSVIPTTSTPGVTSSSATPLLRHPPTAPRAVLRAPAPHLRHRLSVTPGNSTTNPAPSYSPSSLVFRLYADNPLSHPASAPGVVFQRSASQLAFPGPYRSTIPGTFAPTYGPFGGTVTNNGNVNYTTADNSVSRNNGASSSHANGNASGTDVGP